MHEQSQVDIQAASYRCQAAELEYNRQVELSRPCYMLKPALATDGYSWRATLGQVCGRGPTPELAFKAFDLAWKSEGVST